ncbi:MAG TPA: glycosyltransferase family 2 protein [Gaiellaceae bacterium]|nr:glycosyltransferase family 2 protein [Gaiellaceae bacterium]
MTVVIPTRNRADLVGTAVHGALRQDDVDVEVIVVDDRSADETPRRLAAIRDPRVHVLRLEDEGGLAAARNTGIAEARGDWIAFLDDDDLWSPRKLARQLEAAYAARASFVYAGVVIVDEARRPTGAFPVPEPDGLLRRLLARNVLAAGSSNVMARAAVLERIGGFDTQLSQLADWDLWIRLAAAGRAAAVREILVGYVEHQRNMLLVEPLDVYLELEYLAAKHRPLAESLGVEVDRITFSRWTAWGRLRAGRRIEAARLCLAGAVAQRNAGNIVRGLGMLLGERTAARARRRLAPPPVAELAWLSAYR